MAPLNVFRKADEVFFLQDYMEDVHGKEISLQYTTVKVPGMKPRGSKVVGGSSSNDPLASELNTLSINPAGTPGPPLIGRASLTGPMQSNKDKVTAWVNFAMYLLLLCCEALYSLACINLMLLTDSVCSNPHLLCTNQRCAGHFVFLPYKCYFPQEILEIKKH